MAAATFDWADSYDTKDWKRLEEILAPEVMLTFVSKVDYSAVIGKPGDTMSAQDFVSMISDVNLLGNPLISTQHFIGASKYEKLAETVATGLHQIRAAHQRHSSLDKNIVEAKGHGHATMLHTYRKIEGEWKIAGIKPTVYWNEYDFDQIFGQKDIVKGHI
ncbi:scytalone dehydratase [Fusarium mexicanum]|uniref:Scytalone dehydratase n=1 Tax=Fusarium mexicanum TaxID=751941 RepID=A0A8H5I9G1_9HYPO|nr:scytalone dehydratase [Fusarium mexicanum]